MNVNDGIFNELLSLSQEIVSVKVAERNKSVDRLNDLLSTNRDEIFSIMSSNKYKNSITWTLLFSSAIESVLQHTTKLDPSAKGYQTSVNKNPTYRALVQKIVESCFDCKKSKKITGNNLYQGILTLIKNRLAREHFGTMILNIIEETLFAKKLSILSDLKLNDFIELINSIFHMAKRSDSVMIAALRCAYKGIDAGIKCFQCTESLVDIFEYLKIFTEKAENNQGILDIMAKLNLIVMKELVIDDHHKVSMYFIDNIDLMLRLYKPRLHVETKENLYELYYLFMLLFLPQIDADNLISKFEFLEDNPIDWEKYNRKFLSIIESEVKETYSSTTGLENRSIIFQKFASKLFVSTLLYKNKCNINKGEDPPTKICRISTSLEDILNLINKNNRIYTQPIWYTILVIFLYERKDLIDITSFQLLLNITIEFSKQNFDIIDDIRSVHYLTQLLLKTEKHLYPNPHLNTNLWDQFVIFILNELKHETNLLINKEKKELLQHLVKHNKVNYETCVIQIKNFIEINNLINTHNLKLIRQMILIHGVSIIIKCNIERFFAQLYNATINDDQLRAFQKTIDDDGLVCLSEITIFLLLHNFDNLKNKINSDKNIGNNQNELYTLAPDYKKILDNIQFKYLNKFIGVESRKTVSNKYTTHYKNVNYINEKYFEYLLKQSDFQLTDNTSLLHNLLKIEKLIILIENFNKFNIVGCGTETCLMIKKYGLLIESISKQFKCYSINNVSGYDMKKELLIVRKLLKILKKLKEIELYEHCEKYVPNIIEFLNLLNTSITKLKRSSEINEILDELQIHTLQTLSILSVYNKHLNMTAFKIIMNSNLLDLNSITDEQKNINNFFDILQHLLYKTEFEDQEIPNWILENIQIICRLYYNNFNISWRVLDTLPDICFSFKKLSDSVIDIFVILSSYLKICSKLKFNNSFTNKVIMLFKDVAKLFPDLIMTDKDIRDIYTKSIGKFFSINSVFIRFTIIEFISYLLDPTWLWTNSIISTEFIEFSQNLFNSIDWLSIMRSTNERGGDVEMNPVEEKVGVNAILIQLFISITAFSYTNSQSGLLELADFCKNNQIKCENFKHNYLIKQFSEYFTCDFEHLMADSSEKLIEKWINQLDDLPWFLCVQNEKKFYEMNFDYLLFSALKTKISIIRIIENKIGKRIKNISKQILAKCHAFILPYTLKNISNPNNRVLNANYNQEVNVLLENLKQYQVNLQAKACELDLSEVIYSVLQKYSDEEKFVELIGFKTHIIDSEDYNFELLKLILSNFYKKNLKFSNFAKAHPNCIIKVNEKLKFKIFSTGFTKEKLIWLCRYFTLVDLLDIQVENDFHWFCVKDIFFFVSSFLKHYYETFIIFKGAMYFLENFSKKFFNWSLKFEDGYFETINTVIEIAEQANSQGTTEKLQICLNLLEIIFCGIIESKNSLISRLEPLMEKEIFKGTSIELHNNRTPSVTQQSIEEDLNTFNNNKFVNSYNIKKLSTNLSKKKKDFIESAKTPETKKCLNKTFSTLIDKIRNGTEKEIEIAIECLGTIGPVFLHKYAFTNENQFKLYCSDIDVFERAVINVLNKLLFKYNPKSYSAILSAVKFTTNCKTFKDLVTNDKIFKQFFNMVNEPELTNELNFSIREEIDLKMILIENSNEESYEIFLKNLTTKLFKCLKITEFQYLSRENYEFCEAIILPLLKIILEESQQDFSAKLLVMLEHYYHEANNAILRSNKYQKNYTNKRTINLMLNITEIYRLQNKYKIPINLLNAAAVAAYQQSYYLSILYLELWALNEKEKHNFKIQNIDLIQNEIFQKVSLEVYKSIDCKDALNGILDPIKSKMEYFNNNNDWMEILMETDASNTFKQSSFVIDVLKENGLFQLVKTLQMSPITSNNEIDYEVLWRLGDWDCEYFSTSCIINQPSAQCNLINLESDFEKYHYEALRSIKLKDETNTIRAIATAKNIIIKILQESSIESIQNFYKYLTNLMLLRQIEEFSFLQFPSSSNSINTAESILEKWEIDSKMEFGNFKNKERTLAQKIILFELAGTRAERKILEYYNGENIIAKNLLDIIEHCTRFSGLEHNNLSKRYLNKLINLDNLKEEIKLKAELINADILIRNGRKKIALGILKKLVDEKASSANILYRLEANHLMGKYLAEDCDKNFDEIYSGYFQKAKGACIRIQELIVKGSLKTVTEEDINNVRKKLYRSIAYYADREYQQIDTYIKSDDFQKSKEIMEKNRNDAKIVRNNIDESQPNYIKRPAYECLMMLERSAKLDAKNLGEILVSRENYLELALKNHIEYCKMDNSIQSSTVYRIIGLWFQNKENEHINEIIENCQIPSYKFINVLSQLTAQLNSKEEKFIEILKELIIKCALEHPHHTLHHLISLECVNEDLVYFKQNKKNIEQIDLRLKRIKEIMDFLKTNKTVAEIYRQMYPMFINLIECAYLNMIEENKRSLTERKITDNNIPEKMKKMKGLDKVHCPTIPLQIKPFLDPNLEIISIISWESKYESVGGINAPKKIYCNCSDGLRRPQLIKGNDDLRQDAIMQHVLLFMNTLLLQNKNSDLRVGTYKIIPLSKRSGLLEWCTNTITLSHYLCGYDRKSGAHGKYRPKNMSTYEIREILGKYKPAEPQVRLRVYEEVCQKSQPVLHYFFFERFKIPGIWFEKRLAYMNSVATMSMIGYILGLGDRHCQNILLHEKTGEIIHIDFGIAFEKGKSMPTPETIPFRLTREIVAPMGISEVNGVFRKTCELTLQILRENKEVLLTILEVLLHDPLYSWTIKDKILQRMSDSDGNSTEFTGKSENNSQNSTAHRALMQVKAKLEGRSDNQTGSLSVSSQVDKLIADARNPLNLAFLFKGWDPHL